MKIELKQLEKAPKQGCAMIYFQTSLYYGEYQSDELASLLENNDKILEIHLFDEVEEYRAVLSEEWGGYIEAVITDDNQKCDEKYEEKHYIDTEKREKIRVVNYLKYDEEDMLHLVNYRLEKEGGSKHE